LLDINIFKGIFVYFSMKSSSFLVGGRLRIFLVLVVSVSLVFSSYFSFSSFTGYIINESINRTFNFFSLGFFLVGLVGSYFLIKKRA